MLHTRDPRAEVTRAIILHTTERMTHEMGIGRGAHIRDVVLDDLHGDLSRVQGRPAVCRADSAVSVVAASI